MIQIDSKIVRHASIHLLRQFAIVQDDPLAVGETALIVLDDLPGSRSMAVFEPSDSLSANCSQALDEPYLNSLRRRS